MDIEREAIVEAGVAAVGVGLFIAVVVIVGAVFGVHETVDSMAATQLQETGALALVAGMAGFILVMSVLGFWLSNRQEA